MLLVVCVMLAVQLSNSQAAEIIPQPDATENKPARKVATGINPRPDAAVNEEATPVDAPAKNIAELLGINAIVNPTDVDSPEPLLGVICGIPINAKFPHFKVVMGQY